ncbi:tripartite tricarboxylate transporter substrate binding protein [Acetobacteraceae bacterium H6797]|nr:tripartite tricarboxylate transporter substrate binding protein [Acetobacteraceae bacterium H6797]
MAPPWPERGMRCILPFPDGPIGAMARMTLDRMARRLHQPIAYEYRPGATGTIGSDYIARAKPDGYTFGVIGQASHAVLPVLRDLPYDPLKDFAPIGGIASFENVLVVPATSSIRSLDDLIAKAASREAGLLYGSPGIGSAVHLLTELMKIDTGMRLSHVPYTGGTASMTDLLNGRVDLLLVSLPTVADRLRRGQLRPLAMAAAERSLLLPDVPTFAELGYPRIRLSTWIGMAAPDGIPKEALDTLADTLNLSLQEPEVAGRFASLGATPLIDTPDLFINRIASDMAWLREFLPRMGITGQQ